MKTTTTSAPAQASKETIANDLQAAYKDVLNDEQLKAVSANILSAEGTGNATLQYTPLGFKITVEGPGGEVFTAKGSVGGGTTMPGQIYTDDFDVLYSETVSYQMVATVLYVSVTFFDVSNNLLGTFQCAAMGTAPGGGAGTGTWSA